MVRGGGGGGGGGWARRGRMAVGAMVGVTVGSRSVTEMGIRQHKSTKLHTKRRPKKHTPSDKNRAPIVRFQVPADAPAVMTITKK